MFDPDAGTHSLTYAFYGFTVLGSLKRCQRLEAAGIRLGGHDQATPVESPVCGRKRY